MTRETWYVMADGSFGDPREICAGADGVLRHKDGRAVAYAPHGPRSRSVDVDALRAKAAEPAPVAAVEPKREVVADPLDHDGDGKKGGSLPKPADREVKAEGATKTYRTRGNRAD